MDKIQVLKNCEIDGMVLKLPNIQLDRKLYQDVAKSLNCIGGIWNKKSNGFVFLSDPKQLLYKLIDGDNVNLKKEYQFFTTPEKLADYLVEIADIKSDDIVLEPSAGSGNIIKSLNKNGIVTDCYELMELNKKICNYSAL